MKKRETIEYRVETRHDGDPWWEQPWIAAVTVHRGGERSHSVNVGGYHAFRWIALIAAYFAIRRDTIRLRQEQKGPTTWRMRG